MTRFRRRRLAGSLACRMFAADSSRAFFFMMRTEVVSAGSAATSTVLRVGSRETYRSISCARAQSRHRSDHPPLRPQRVCVCACDVCCSCGERVGACLRLLAVRAEGVPVKLERVFVIQHLDERVPLHRRLRQVHKEDVLADAQVHHVGVPSAPIRDRTPAVACFGFKASPVQRQRSSERMRHSAPAKVRALVCASERARARLGVRARA